MDIRSFSVLSILVSFRFGEEANSLMDDVNLLFGRKYLMNYSDPVSPLFFMP